MAHTRVYREGKLVVKDFPPEEVSEYLKDPKNIVWLDIGDPTSEHLELIREELGLDPFAVEDAVKGRQRPKLEHFKTHGFLTAYSTSLEKDSGEIATQEVAAFMTKHALVTVRRDEAFDVEELMKRWDNSPEIARFGTSAMVYGLLDLVVDSHFETVQSLDDAIEELEDVLFDESRTRERTRLLQRRTFELRRSLVLLRRVVLPMREVINSVIRRETEISEEGMLPYFQDVYDHVLRASEWTEGLRDLVTTIFETNLSLQDHTLNAIMKKLTGWGAIIAVPTAVTGFYGQNVPFPGFGSHRGFIIGTAVWVGISLVLFNMFRRRDWI